MCKLDNLFKTIVTNALIFQWFLKIRSTCVSKVGYLFWTHQTLQLNSKIDPGTDTFSSNSLFLLMLTFAIFHKNQFRKGLQLCLPCNFFWNNFFVRVFSYTFTVLMNKFFKEHFGCFENFFIERWYVNNEEL